MCRRSVAVWITASLFSLGCGHSEPPGGPAGAASGTATSLASADAGSGTSATRSASAVPVAVSGAPVVDLQGVTTLPSPPAAQASRIGAVRWVVRVRARPDRKSKELGTLRAGAIIEARPQRSPASAGCRDGWRAIVPTGYVCMSDATTDLHHPVLVAASRRPDFAARLPYMYGTVTRGGPVYARIPTAAQLRTLEPHLKEHLAKWRDDETSGASYGLDVWLRYTDHKVPGALEALEARTTEPDLPDFLAEHRVLPAVGREAGDDDPVKIDQVNRHQGRSFIRSVLFEGRRYNVTPDLVVIPADRFRPIRGSAFHGWRVGSEIKLPFALVRRPGARRWQWRKSAGRMVDGGPLGWRTAWELNGKQRFYRQRLHYQTTAGFWVDDRHGTRVDPARRWPKWAKQGGKWIDVKLTGQVVLAYEGKRMVYATLVSTGEAGLDNPETSTATKRGIFRIHTKWASVTMDSDVVGEQFELRDVPYVQYFEGGYAIHGAYWHDGFGRPKSHGCINLAPEDARRLFFWTEPTLPTGWQSVRQALTGTVVFVHP